MSSVGPYLVPRKGGVDVVVPGRVTKSLWTGLGRSVPSTLQVGGQLAQLADAECGSVPSGSLAVIQCDYPRVVFYFCRRSGEGQTNIASEGPGLALAVQACGLPVPSKGPSFLLSSSTS